MDQYRYCINMAQSAILNSLTSKNQLSPLFWGNYCIPTVTVITDFIKGFLVIRWKESSWKDRQTDRHDRNICLKPCGQMHNYSHQITSDTPTGYYTGSVYSKHNLLSAEFPGEAVPFDSGEAIAIKTHHSCSEIGSKNYERVILLIRDPVATMKAEYNREHTGNKTGVVDKLNETGQWASL